MTLPEIGVMIIKYTVTVKPVLSDTLKRECKKGAVKGRLIQDQQENHDLKDFAVARNVVKHRMSLNTGVGQNRFNCKGKFKW